MRLCSATLALILVVPIVAADDWPQFRGPTGMGVVAKELPEKWSQNENLAWKVEIPGPGNSTPIVWGDRIYLGYYSGSGSNLERHLLALDRKTGKRIWDEAVPVKLPEQERIREEHGYTTNSPTVDADRVYAFFGKSGVFAFSHDGKKLWQADVGDKLNGWGSAASPVLVDDLVIVNASVESESLVALDKKTGEEKWRLRGIRESWNTPVLVKPVEGEPELIVAIFGKVLGIDPKTGKQLWTCDTDIGWYMVPSVVAHDGIIYCLGGRPGGSLAVKVGGRGDVTRTHRLWTSKKGTNVPSPVYHEGKLYWMHDNLELAFRADAKTGAVEYEHTVNRAGGVYASALLANGKIYYVTRDGKTYVVRPGATFDVIAENDLRQRGERFDASPTAMGNQLLIRSTKHLYCIGK